MSVYYYGRTPQIGDKVESLGINPETRESNVKGTVTAIEKGRINIKGKDKEFVSLSPKGFKLLSNKGGTFQTFWDAAKKSKEGDTLECEYIGLQNVINNGDYTFMWEEDLEPVTLSGEFIGLKWRVKSV